MLLDDDADLRDALCDMFALFGADCLPVASLAELSGAAERALACDLAVLDVNLGDGQPSGVDAYDWLRQRRFGGRVVFLTGHAPSNPAVARAAALGVRVLTKPIGTDEMRALANRG
ncbi:MAG TPA: response regulator [Polyangia bacterium]